MAGENFHSDLQPLFEAFDEGRLQIYQLVSDARLLTAKHFPARRERAEHLLIALNAIKDRNSQRQAREGGPTIWEQMRMKGKAKENSDLIHAIYQAQHDLRLLDLEQQEALRLEMKAARRKS